MDPQVGDRWTLLGTIGAGGRVRIDRHGVVAPEGATWSLDWWVGAEDRWHIASDGALVRQSLVDATPVVLSAMRLPGGEIEQRAWGAVDGGSGLPVLVVDLHNATSVPVALALAFTSSAGDGTTIDVSDGVVSIDGAAVARFSRLPSRFAVDGPGRSARAVTVTGEASATFPSGGVRTGAGRATVAFVFPLPHTATLRVVLPLRADVDVADLARLDPWSLPPFERVVAGWKAQVARAPRFDLPERGLDAAVDAARCHLLVHVATDDPLRFPGVVVDGHVRSELTMALDEQGLSVEGERLLLAALEHQAADGSFDADRLDATAAWLVAAERHVTIGGSAELARALSEPVVSAAHWLSRRQRNRLRRSHSFFATGAGPRGMSETERVARDARLTRRSYLAAIRLLDIAGETDAALAVRLHLAALVEEMERRAIDDVDPETDIASLGRLRADLLAGEPLWAWSSGIDAHDPALTAAFLRNLRALVVDDGSDVVDLLPGFGEPWLGQPLAVHRLPTAAGTLSFALRWHGARPALLWEVEGDRSFTLACSSIDPGWSSREARGETLLSAPVLDHVHLSGAFDSATSPDSGSAAESPVAGGGSFS